MDIQVYENIERENGGEHKCIATINGKRALSVPTIYTIHHPIQP
jgi:hypothetical protein